MRLQVFKEGGRLQLPGKQPLNMRFLEFFVLLMEKGPPSSPPPIKVLIMRRPQAAAFAVRLTLGVGQRLCPVAPQGRAEILPPSSLPPSRPRPCAPFPCQDAAGGISRAWGAGGTWARTQATVKAPRGLALRDRT